MSPLGTGIGLGLGQTARVAGLARAALQIVATRGDVSYLLSPNGKRQSGRVRHYVGAAATETLACVDGNWYVQATAEVNSDFPFALRRAVEYNGVTVPMTWGGQQEIVLQPGDTVTSDEVSASAFGLEEFPAGALIWLRWERTRDLSQTMPVHLSSAYPTQISGEAVVSRSDDLGTQVYNTGSLTTGSGWSNTFGATIWLPLAVIGRPKAPSVALLVAGASKEVGQSDSNGDGNNDGGGYVRRAVADVGGAPMAYTSIARAGEGVQNFLVNSAKRRQILQYATHVYIGHGGNDYSLGQTIENTLPRLSQEWELLREHGAELLMNLEMPKTTSTDSFATVANQTPRAGYETGGTWRDVFNQYILDAAVAGDVNRVVDLNAAVADPTLTDIWQAGATPDGIHPSKSAHISLAALMRTELEQVRAAYEAA